MFIEHVIDYGQHDYPWRGNTHGLPGDPWRNLKWTDLVDWEVNKPDPVNSSDIEISMLENELNQLNQEIKAKRAARDHKAKKIESLKAEIEAAKKELSEL
jgi:hypothetical protein